VLLDFSQTVGEGSEKTYSDTLSESLDVTVGYKAKVKKVKVLGASGTREGSVGVNVNTATAGPNRISRTP
jgi:hypothetical protein